MKYDVVIIGCGPGGLRCGQLLASHGARVLLLEKKPTIGPKVCAGGITWQGLIERVPHKLLERSFSRQKVLTRLQKITVHAPQPIIATISRYKLGQYMAEQAQFSGAEIITRARVYQIGKNCISYCRKKKSQTVSFDYLIGADGAMSKVRQHLEIPTSYYGIGIDYTLPLEVKDMEWNFDAARFGSGYTWIFPHASSVSVGAYQRMPMLKAAELNVQLLRWLEEKKMKPHGTRPRAGKIACDFRGWKFGKYYLIGDAAGLASPLTGEGIYPAFVSAEAVADSIINNNYRSTNLENVLRKHRRHATMHKLACRHTWIAFLLSEVSALLLRSRLISSSSFEMA